MLIDTTKLAELGFVIEYDIENSLLSIEPINPADEPSDESLLLLTALQRAQKLKS